MGADAETLSRGVWARTPAVVPALAGQWRLLGTGVREWTSPCGRVTAQVWANTHDKDWRWTVDSPLQSTQTVGNPAPSREEAQTLALDTARERLAELDAAPTPAKVGASKWHPIAESIAATVAEKNATYGDSFARSGEVMAVLYPNGIAPGQMADALAVVRVVDKLFRVATDRDALGESPWRDIAGYALLACERAGK